MSTRIPWAQETWNPITGCTQISDACLNCYAKTLAETRLRGRAGYSKATPFKPRKHRGRLHDPFNWKSGKVIFPVSMGDLYHKDIDDDFIVEIFDTMNRSPQHKYLVLTKRPERALKISKLLRRIGRPSGPHILHGTTIERQKYVKRRLRYLLRIPGTRFISAEPLLEPINVEEFLGVGIDWVIAGCEKIRRSPGRPISDAALRSLRDQCKRTGVPFFLKQKVINGQVRVMPELDGRIHNAAPEILRSLEGANV